MLDVLFGNGQSRANSGCHRLFDDMYWLARSCVLGSVLYCTLLDTGDASMTGGRLKRALDHIGHDDTVLMTYGDGVSDIDINDLLKFHKAHGRMATVTITLPRTSFGMLNISDDNVVTGFQEKPKIESFVNCGFFVFNRKIFDYMSGDDCILERDVLPKIAAEGQLMAYKHMCFWDCMDTYKDNVTLNEQWAKGEAPWKLWSE